MNHYDFELLMDSILYLLGGATLAVVLGLLADWLERRWPWPRKDWWEM